MIVLNIKHLLLLQIILSSRLINFSQKYDIFKNIQH
jgi:hypothetical protein